MSLLILTFLCCSTLSAREITIIAHRGNSSEAPENTLPAFQEAINIGADFIEFDIHLTKEGIPVVCHDCIAGRTTDNSYPIPIMDIPLVQLKSYDAGSWFDEMYEGTTVPTLEEVFNLTQGRVGLMIEIKTGSATESKLAREVLQVVEQNRNTEYPILIGSLSPGVLESVRRINPQQPIIAIVNTLQGLSEHMQNHPDRYALNHKIATPELIYRLKKTGKKIWVFTVDSPSRMHELVNDGIDGFITNRPRILGRAVVRTEG